MAEEINACSRVLGVNVFHTFCIYFILYVWGEWIMCAYHSAPVQVRGQLTGMGPWDQTHCQAQGQAPLLTGPPHLPRS